jgi:hypothetical protein
MNPINYKNKMGRIMIICGIGLLLSAGFIGNFGFVLYDHWLWFKIRYENNLTAKLTLISAATGRSFDFWDHRLKSLQQNGTYEEIEIINQTRKKLDRN